MTGARTRPETAARKPRADAERNRQRLLEVAKAAFSARGGDASLEAIARDADVGIGTLYRHFPTRDALLEAVYRREVERLAEAARELAATRPPVAALREWMLVFVEYFAAKKLIMPALNAILGDPSDLYAASGVEMRAAMSLLIERAVASGEIRLDLDPFDLLRAIAGVASVDAGADWQARARQLVDILVAGLRVPPGE